MIFRIRTIITALLLGFIIAGAAVSASNGDAAGLVAQGDALVKSKNYSEALAAYELAIEIDKNNFAAWNGKADALNRVQEYTDALAASDTALALQPSDTKGWINRGYILYNLGRYADELKAYEMAISLEPGNAEAWFNKGYALAGMKRYDEAIAAFDTVNELRPDYPNLAANRRIAERERDAGIPAYLRYAPILAGILLVAGITAGYIVYWRKNLKGSKTKEKESRQSRRRKVKEQ